MDWAGELVSCYIMLKDMLREQAVNMAGICAVLNEGDLDPWRHAKGQAEVATAHREEDERMTAQQEESADWE